MGGGSTCPLFSKPLGIFLNATITICTTITFIIQSFFNSLLRSRFLTLFSLSSSFTMWSARTVKFFIHQAFFLFFLLLTITRFDRVAKIRRFVRILKSYRAVCVLFSRTDFVPSIYLTLTLPLVRILTFQVFFFFAQFALDHLPHPIVSVVV